MAILVTQLRPEELTSVIEFAKTVGCELSAEDINPSVSLLAKDGETVVAAVLAHCSTERTCELNVCLGQPAGQSEADRPEADGASDPAEASTAELTGELINKALMKVHGAGIRRCRINHHGDADVPSNWPGSPWTGQADTEAA